MAYKPIHNYRQRDKLPPNDPNKIIYGSHLSDDFEAISRALEDIEGGVAPSPDKPSSGIGAGYDDTQIKADLASETQARIDGDANLQSQIDDLSSGGGGEYLKDLTDVDLSKPPSDGDQLTFDSVTQKWIAARYSPFPSELPDSIPGDKDWTGQTEVVETTGSLGLKINGVDYGSGPATINSGNTLTLYWLGDPDSGEHIDSPDGTDISGSIRAEKAGSVSVYYTTVDKNPSFDFQDMLDVEADQVIESEIVTVSDANSYCYFSGSSDSAMLEYKKNTEAWTAVAARSSVYFESGDDIQLRHTSGGEGETVTSTVTIGERTVTWSTTSIVSGILTPTIESPQNDAIDISQSPTLTASTYETFGSPLVHASTDWQVMNEGGDVIYESLNNASDLEAHTVTDKLDMITVYRCRVRYRAADGRESEWSPIATFTTVDLIPGQIVHSSGTKNWVVPEGCYSVTVVCVGAGGGGSMGTESSGSGAYSGGGGGLQWLNDYPVEPGQTITLKSNGVTFADGTVLSVRSASQNAPGSPSGVLDGGQSGGDGCSNAVSSHVGPTHSKAGGGGAAGYTGRGGYGGKLWSSSTYNGAKGNGGGGGGGASSGWNTNAKSKGGGGGGGKTFLYGKGGDGGGGAKGPYNDVYHNYPTGTQRGGNGSAGYGSTGGGGGAASPVYDTGHNPHGGGSGWAIRLVWPGDESRGHFPDLVVDV